MQMMVLFTHLPALILPKWQKITTPHVLVTHTTCTSSSSFSVRCSYATSVSQRPIRYAVLGAGFAGLSVAWHLLKNVSKESDICVDIYDEVGIGGGASGVAGGLIHPYSPKVKLLWRGAECWKESLNLVNIAEDAFIKLVNKGEKRTLLNGESSIIRRRGILRPAVNLKHKDLMVENAQNSLDNCRIESIHEDDAQNLVPNLCVPLNLAFYMPEALTINAQHYLEGLYLACENLINDTSTLDFPPRELRFHKKSVNNLQELAGEYDAVIICLGARSAFLPELSGKLPLRTCRGIIAQMKLGDNNIGSSYPDHSPSILSDAWLSVQGPRDLDLGSTWDWNSINYSREVTMEEATNALEILLPKASSVYPDIKNWTVTGSVAGLRAMPPVTIDGSLPLVGCVDEHVDGNNNNKKKNGCCKYWLFTGLGARGLLFHGLIGKIVARAVISGDENVIPEELTSWKKKVHMVNSRR